MLEIEALKKVDLMMLSCLVELVAKRSVTRAAEQMEMTQPAMSVTLSKLRGIFSDPLLVRTNQGMQPTTRAIELVERVRPHLRELESVLTDNSSSDLASMKGTVKIAVNDHNGLVLFSSISERLLLEAPDVTLVMQYPDFKHMREWLEDGHCDLAIGYFPDLQKVSGLRVSGLFTEPYCVIAAAGHPDIRGSLSLDQYLEAKHVTFNSPFASLPAGDELITEALSGMGYRRKIGIQLTSALLSGHMVAETRMIATINSRLAHHFSELLPVHIYELPFDAPEFTVSQFWHERTHRSGKRVRELIRATMGQSREI